LYDLSNSQRCNLVEMISSEIEIRVRYSETDQMGFVYYGNYAAYFEVGRVEALRKFGIEYANLEEEYGIWMPVTSMQIRYLRPARYDELIVVKTTLRKLPEKFITFDYEVKNQKGDLLNAATVRLCFIDAKTQKQVLTPIHIVDLLREHFEV